MTSLELFPATPRNTSEPPEWGTGNMLQDRNIWVPKGPTWHHTGEPQEQHYHLTKLKLSNVRNDDQLLPNPQHSEMGRFMLHQPFPAEHPYASHQSKFAVFPKFDTPGDPQRGVKARSEMPLNDEMPANPYDVVVVKKTKGSGMRHEIRKLPSESKKKPLVWHEHNFHQLVKGADAEKQDYYPTPPVTYVPNLKERQGDMLVTPRTANATRNLERAQWQTHYNRQHTGMGPANPPNLDNYDEKQAEFLVTGKMNHTLRPRSVPEFSPAEPFEGRIARANIPQPPPLTDRWPDAQPDASYKRMMTETEREEDRLWNGMEHVNLPEGHSQWKEEQQSQNPEYGLNTLVLASNDSAGVPQTDRENKDTSGQSVSYLEEMRQKEHDRNQQMEASNRWKDLEGKKPEQDLLTLKHKLEQMPSDKSHPEVFYTHEGDFQAERAGMYKTSYDPYRLQETMAGDDRRGSGFVDTTHSYQGALDLPMQMNQDVAHILRYNRTLGGPPGSVAQLNGQPSQHEVFAPYEADRKLKKAQLQPTMNSTGPKIQERGVVLKESSYGDSYNTRKFLQENVVPDSVRKEPLLLMSSENSDLNQVRFASIPIAKTGSPPMCVRSDPGEIVQSAGTPMFSRPHTSPDGDKNASFRQRYSYQADGNQGHANTQGQGLHSARVGKVQARHSIGTPNQFASNSSNFLGGGQSVSWSRGSAYQSQFAGSGHKLDDVTWRPGCGFNSPQDLIDYLERNFSQTEARKKFHSAFPEGSPDVRQNTSRGKKHSFGGVNAQVLRGAPVVA